MRVSCLLALILLNTTAAFAAPAAETCEGLRTLLATADLSSLKGPEMDGAWRSTLEIPGTAGVVVAEVDGKLVALVGITMVSDAGSESNALSAADATVGQCLLEHGWSVLGEGASAERGGAWVKANEPNGIRVTLQRPFEEMPSAAYLMVTPGLSPAGSAEEQPAKWLQATVVKTIGNPGERAFVTIDLGDGNTAPKGSLVRFRRVRLIYATATAGRFVQLEVWANDSEEILRLRGRRDWVSVCPLPCGDDNAWAEVESQGGDWVHRAEEAKDPDGD